MKEMKKNSFMKTPSAPGLCRRIGRALRSATARTALPTFLLLAFSILHAPFSTVKAQGEADNWYFGRYAGIKFVRDANGKVTGTQPLTDGALDTHEGCSTISDADGNLLFYSDGIYIWDKNHNLMPGANGIGNNILVGDPSSSQAGIVVPRPGYPNRYYVFAVPVQNTNPGLSYAEVDMTLRGGLGDVLAHYKNPALLTPTSEKIAAVRHADGVRYWLLAHAKASGTYYAFLIDQNGVNTTPVASAIGQAGNGGVWAVQTIGYLIVSPDGKKVAAAHYVNDVEFELMDFNNATGRFSNLKVLVAPEMQQNAYGVAFSPNSKVLYGSGLRSIYQWDITRADPNEARTEILRKSVGAMQLGPDGKIYVSPYGAAKLDRIDCPNTLGLNCNYQQNVVDLGGRSSTYGLPPFMASFFNTPPKQIKITSDTQPLPGGSGIELSLTGMGGYTKIDWDFGDGKTANNQTTTSITHIYDNAGYYTVKATLKGDPCDPEAYVFFTFFVGEPKLDNPASTTICAPSLPVELALVEDIGALEPYVWKEKISGTVVGTGTSVTVTPAATTEYAVSTRVLDVWNRFTNGSFENAASHDGYGIIAVDPKTVLSGINPGFTTVGMPDVNPGEATGKKLAVDARGKAGQAFWKQTVPGIVAKRDYIVSFYHRRLTNSTSPSDIRIKINNALVGPSIVPVGDWEKTEFTWNSGTAAGNIAFELVETTGSSGENFFVIDDIVLNKIKEVDAKVTVTVNDVNPGEIESAFSGSNNFIVCRSSGTVGWLNEKIPSSLAPGGSFTSGGYLWQETTLGANAPDGDWDTYQPLSTGHAMSPAVPATDTWYRRKVTYTNDGVDCAKESNVLVVMVNEAKGGAIGPNTQAVCEYYGEAKLTNQTEGYANGTRRYRWKRRPASPTPTPWANVLDTIPGATGQGYTVKELEEDTEFVRVTVSTRKDPNGVDVECDELSNEVKVTVKKIEPPTTAHKVQHDCAPGVIGEANRKLDWLLVTGTKIKWYDENGRLLDDGNTPALKHDTVYYASQTLNRCESYNRLPVKYVKDVTVTGGGIRYTTSTPVVCHPEKLPEQLLDDGLGSSNAGGVSYVWKIKTRNNDWEELPHFGNRKDMLPKVQMEKDGNNDYKYLTNTFENRYRRHAQYTLPQDDVCEAFSNEQEIVIIHVDGGAIESTQVVCQNTDLADLKSVTLGDSKTNNSSPKVTYLWRHRKLDEAGTGTGWASWVGGHNINTETSPDYINVGTRSVGTWQIERRTASKIGLTTCYASSNAVTITVRKYKDGENHCGLFPQKTVVDLGKPSATPPVPPNMMAEAGETLTYTIVVKNEWDRDVNDVVVEDEIPAGTIYLSSPATYGRTEIGSPVNKLKWTIPLIDKKGKLNDKVPLTFNVKVVDNLTGVQEIPNTVMVIATYDTPADLPDGPEQANVDIKTNPRLSIDREATEKKLDSGASGNSDSKGKPMVEAENELEYTITVKNGGDVDLKDVKVTDKLPEGTVFDTDLTTDPNVSGFTPPNGNDSMRWTIDLLKWDESVDLKFKVKVKKDLTGVDSIRNTAVVADTLYPIAFRKTDPKSAMKVEKKITNLGTGRGDNNKFVIGDPINYDITVENDGDLEIHNINITDPNADIPNVGYIQTLKVNDGHNVENTYKYLFHAVHTVTQADVDAGFVANLAHAAGTDANGNPVTADSEAPPGQTGTDCKNGDCDPNATPPTDGSTVTAIDPREAKVEIKKEPVPLGKTDYVDNGGVGPDGKIQYRITVTNTGDRTLKYVKVTDTNADLASVPAAALSLPPYYLDKDDKTKTNPAGQWVFFVEHTVTQPDLDRGYVDNTAKVESAMDDLNKFAEAESKKIQVDIKHDPKLTVTKTVASTPTYTDPDDGELKYVLDPADGHNVITYNIRVENTGLLTLKDIMVEDPNADSGSLVNTTNALENPKITELKPGDAHIFRATHTVTQADVDLGKVINIATAKGKTKIKEVTAEAADTVEAPVYAKPAKMEVTKALKDPNKTDYKLDGDIAYTITVENTGGLTLRTIELDDPNATIGKQLINIDILPDATYADLGSGGLDGDILRLAPGGKVTYKAVRHQVGQADIDRGQVDNWATANGADARGNSLGQVESTDASNPACSGCDPVTGHPNATSVLIKQDPAWEMTKKVMSTGDNGKYKLNDVVKYLITVKNTGNVTLANIVVTDLKADEADLKTGRAITAPAPNGGEVTLEATHKVTQADVDKGKVENLARAVGDSPAGAPPLPPARSKNPDDQNANPGDPTVVQTEQTYGLTFTKQADRSKTNYAVGDKISYDITVENTGSTTIKNVTVTDLNADSGPLVFGPQNMAPGKVVIPVEHTVTQPDLDRGYVDNLAKFEGEDYTGTPVTDDSEDPDCPTCPNTTVPVKDPAPKMEMEKAVVNKGDMPFNQGDKIRYEITVKNTGNVPLTDIAVSDNNADARPVGKNGEANPIPLLMPGAELVFTAEHTVTAADVAAGHVDNLASAKGKDPQGETTGPVASVNPDRPTDTDGTGAPTTPVKIERRDEMEMEKKAKDKTKDYKLNEKIEYGITVRNTGNTTLENIKVTDPFADEDVNHDPWTEEVIPLLEPGQAHTFTVFHIVTQADVDKGKAENVAFARGDGPTGGVYTSSKDPDNGKQITEVEVDKTALGKLVLTKAVTNRKTNPKTDWKVDEVIHYDIAVTNPGRLTLRMVQVTDPDSEEKAITIPRLAPNGGTEPLKFTHKVTQADIDRGIFKNLATARAEDLRNGNVGPVESYDPDCCSVPGVHTEVAIDRIPGMTVEKKVANKGDMPFGQGDRIRYEITVKNTGNVTLANIKIDDPNADLPNSWTIASLAPQDAPHVIKAEHTVTAVDVARGYVNNLASAKGKDPAGGDGLHRPRLPGLPGHERADRHARSRYGHGEEGRQQGRHALQTGRQDPLRDHR